MSREKVINHKGMEDDAIERLESENIDTSIGYRGINGDRLTEALPEYIESPCEKVYKHGDVHIVFGRDRPGHRTSGYGASGDTKAHSLDIVIGRLGHLGVEFNEQGESMHVDPSFQYDAARFFISQKSDVDDYFGLVDGGMERVIGKSAVALKADALRFISRGGGIKFVTNVDKVNSRGGKISKIEGISLVAGNDDKSLQPMVLGGNATEFMEKLVNHVEKLSAVVDGMLQEQTKMNQYVIQHKHISPFFGQLTLPSEQLVLNGPAIVAAHLSKTKQSLITFKVNLANLKNTYLSQAGTKSVKSRYNKSN